MSTTCELLSPRDPRLSQVKPIEIPTFIRIKEDPVLALGLHELGNGQIVAAFAYGSQTSGEAKPDSMHDYQIVVRDRDAYYPEQMKRRPRDFGKATTELLSFAFAEAGVFQAMRGRAKSAALYGGLAAFIQVAQPHIESWIHSNLNRLSPNYYHSEIQVGDRTQKVKVVVSDLDTFATQMRGSGWFRGGEDGFGYLYAAGRFGKASIDQIIMDKNPLTQSDIYLAINQDRIDHTWMGLARVPNQFDIPKLAKEMIRLSYLADIRTEPKDKVDQIYNQNPEGYEEMVSSILEAFEKHGFVEKLEDGSYIKNVSLRQEDVDAWLKEGAKFSFGINYLKNPATVGISRGIGYIIAKFRRAGGPQQLLNSAGRRLGAFGGSGFGG